MLGSGEPREAGSAQQRGDEEVEPQPEDVVRRIDTQRLLEDAEARVPGDVEREESWRPDAPRATEQHQEASKAQVPDDLVEKGRVERRVGGVGRRTVGEVDVERPWQVRRAAEKLLVEIVADSPDRLRDEQAGRGSVEETGDVGSPPVQDPDARRRPGCDAAPDAEPAMPDRERPPPGVRSLIPARDEKVDPPADDPSWEAPDRNLVDELPLATHMFPATPRDRDRSQDSDQVAEAVDMDEERADPEPVVAWTRDGAERVRRRIFAPAFPLRPGCN